jgi:Thiol-disulfide isomerase and thioredoxins
VTSRKQLAVVASIIVVVGALIGAGRYYLSDELAPVGVGAKAPGFSAMTLDAKPVTKTLDEYQGQVVLINIWATWCAPCRIEMPSIEKLHEAYARKGLKVVAISVDDPGHRLARS